MDTSYYTLNKDKISAPSGRYAGIRCIVIDVDGTMTDGGIYYDEKGNEFKKFSAKDAAGFFAAKVCGIKILVLTGRECQATKRRMEELQVDFLEQQITDKIGYLKNFMKKNDIQKDELAYLGDDLNDYESMKLAGFVGCPMDSASEIKAISDYISPTKGGEGAVRDMICYLLKDRGQWGDAIRSCYKMRN